MSNILKELQTMEGDALLIQFNADEFGFPSYSEADAIIRRINTPTGPQWAFHTLVFMNERCVEITGRHGSVEDVACAAFYQFGSKLSQSERLEVSYKDSDFPAYLIPKDNVVSVQNRFD